jgi:hypothetical protein
MTGLDISDRDRKRAVDRLDEVIYLLQRSDAQKFKSQRLQWYLSAARSIIKAPVFERDLWERLLVHPLEEIVTDAPPGADIGKIANQILEWVNETLTRQA